MGCRPKIDIAMIPKRQNVKTGEVERRGENVVRGKHEVVRGNHDVVRGNHVVVRGKHEVVRGNHDVLRERNAKRNVVKKCVVTPTKEKNVTKTI